MVLVGLALCVSESLFCECTMQEGGQAKSSKEIDAHELVPRLRSTEVERSDP